MTSYQLTTEERKILEWQLTDVDEWISHVEATFPNCSEIITQKVISCRQRKTRAGDKRPRVERDAAEYATFQPTELDVELARARAYAATQAALTAAKALRLKEAETYLTTEAMKLEQQR